jgi:His-Xaa-Ser system radical SAM maturase HxsB
VEVRSLPLSPLDVAADQLGFFRWGRVGGRIVVTNDAADWAILTDAELADLLEGRVGEAHPRFREFQSKGFLRDGLDLDALAARVAQRNRHVRRGAYVHIVTLTSRGGAGAERVDMTAETAERVAELALQSTSPALTFEFQGHGADPLLNVDVLRHFVEFTENRNKRSVGKAISYRLLSNFTAMTEAAAEWLLANGVLVITSLDGPAAVHDENRAWRGGSPHADVVRWIAHFQRRAAELGRDAQETPVEALATVTRRSLGAGHQIVDEYVQRGLRSIHLRPLDRTRVDPETWARVGYSPEEYLAFYRGVLAYIVQVNGRGVALAERLAAILATKILTADDPGAVDIQSPHGGGTSQLAYSPEGRVFPCDEARVLDAGGDPIFMLGDVRELTLPDIARHPTVRAIASASLLDSQPMCADCWNKPFCGYSPVRNFIAQGDLIGQRPRCFECKEHMAVSTQIFGLLDGSPEATETLKGWTTTRSPFAVDGRASKPAP